MSTLPLKSEDGGRKTFQVDVSDLSRVGDAEAASRSDLRPRFSPPKTEQPPSREIETASVGTNQMPVAHFKARGPQTPRLEKPVRVHRPMSE